MAEVVIMPKQGQSVESCILTELKKRKGDKVAVGDILFAYETDKASFEEESKFEGTVLEVFFKEGDEVTVLSNVMVIGQPGESIEQFVHSTQSDEPQTEQSAPIVEQSVESAAAGVTVNSTVAVNASCGVSPRARALAQKSGIVLSNIAGTGPNGRIIERDVIAAIEGSAKMTPLAKAIALQTGAVAPQRGSGLNGTARGVDMVEAKGAVAAAEDSQIKPLSNMRKIIAKAMHASLQNSAQLTHHLSADARRIMELRKAAKKAAEEGRLAVNITLNDLVCFAVIKALQKFPNVNSHFLGDSMRLFSKVHLALAVDTERGLMVPVVKCADELTIVQLAERLKEVAAACKRGSIDPDLLSSEAASFTVSNLGNYGVEMFTPVINLPQSAILGVNTIVPRPKDIGGGVYAFVPHIGLSLTYDHRALDGGEATRFLKQIAIEIETLDIEF
ncbi:MAG: 2-oxo acid dehydrogenase subunit E2 [Alistipes sp.]|nr:2-oxo acid dehydrogenase subunit E2 [Alistipes sp.]